MYILNKYKAVIIVVVAALLFITIVRQCEKEPRITTVTRVDIKKIKDSIKEVLLKEIEPVYIDTGSIKYIKGNTKWRDSLVYVDKPGLSTIKALQYETVLKGTKASANIKIVSLGEVLDVSGTFTYPEKETTTTITKTKAKSGLFIYGSVPFNTNNINIEAGVMYQFKNTIIVGVGGQYDDFSKSAYLKGTVAIRVF